MKPLDLYSFPLHGVSLIEASAGTGKTFTIAGLYLRLLLERGLSVREILVVTFTNAATEELRDRIRRSIRAALQGFTRGESDDALVSWLITQHPDAACASRVLRDALVCMDEAAIYTIHGFCQRLLQDHAFESGMLFEAEFITDETDYLRSIAEDFWRRHFYQADPALVSWVASQWRTPQALMAPLSRYIKRDDLQLTPGLSDADLAAAEQVWQLAWQSFKRAWSMQGEAFAEFLLTSDQLNRNKYRVGSIEPLLAAMPALVSSADAPLCLPEKFALLTQEKLADSMKKGALPPDFDVATQADQLLASMQQAHDTRKVVWQQRALLYYRQELASRKQRSQVISTDDLLEYSQRALLGPAGEALGASLRKRYPVALIDEFQDTDPLQYQIFRTIYPGGADEALWMIGDPKQAIYSFRGADIFTYMQARRETANHFTLDTNWRSTTTMVEAVNALFGEAERPFVYHQDIAFYPVKAAGSADQTPLLIDQVAPAPVQVWLDQGQPDNPLSKEAARASMAERCAREVLELLTKAASGNACIGDQPLRPRDIAILVRSHVDARASQQALQSVGIASAYLGRNSVFQSPEALALQTLLLAVTEPNNERLLRAAYCGDILYGSASELEMLLQDELRWEMLLDDFHGYHQQWLQHGFMAMFQRLMQQYDVAARLLSLDDGERRLTNLLQLADLLQEASHQQHGIEGLLSWYQRQLQQPQADSDGQQMRLESDADLVQIVTVHRSKGLEYAVVMLPFLWASSEPKRDQPVLFHHPETQAAMLDLATPVRDEHIAWLAQEVLAEDLRLLYVALTRAKYLCHLAWGPYSGAKGSALGYLLAGSQERAWSDYLAGWSRLMEKYPLQLCSKEMPGTDIVPKKQRAESHPVLAARTFTGRIDSGWRVSSYSALIGHGGSVKSVDDRSLSRPEVERVTTEVRTVFTFPRGANAGHMLHGLFEQIDFTQPHSEGRDELILGLLRQYGFDDDWLSVVRTWVSNVLDSMLDQQGLRLCQIRREQRLDELEFHYPLAAIHPSQLNALLAGLDDYRGEGQALEFMPHKGMMTGYIDMVFEHQGRYYLLDYKSNHLGTGSEHYARAQLVEAMQVHRYDLQYLIYTVALHRYLRWRLVDYDYERHFGGVYYLFIRGMAPDTGDSGVYFTRPPHQLVAALDALFAGRS